ncbi:uncharacterized protein BX664DRAFT_123767 [Halteromyces radiatus]|uniref:uncharacterized protein n=1 Tax=Halteromyces radiatus TaxID=101107 RepID=UPI002221030A|nr:uncharacterized protein BX664DRAFT_123767 [Halteromyces radiatus]KAI8088930.1 hypothetical protein BX664DRAFT_123767 [Halteromyces radiatus]
MFYPLETGSCRNTEYVVCGLPSKAHGSNPVGVTDNKPTTNNAHPDQAVMNSGNNGKDTTTDTTNHMDQINNNNHPSIPSGYVASPGAQATNVPQAAHNDATTGRTPNDNQNENDLVFSLKIADMNYRVIRLQETHLTLESATSFCTSHRDNLGSLYATSLPTFSSWMQRVHPTETIIIGSWNGDSYGAGQSQCLLYSTTGGIHLGSCSDASILLCESDFENDTPQYKST